MKKALFVLLILSIMVLVGCGQQQSVENNANVPVASQEKAVCGNGVVEKGETSENCCLDVACPEFFTCERSYQDGKTINNCTKIRLEDTTEYGNVMRYLREEIQEYYNTPINYDTILTKISLVNENVQKLSSAYDVAIEQLYVKYRYDRRDWNVNTEKINAQIAATTDKDAQKQLSAQIIELDKKELQRLQSFTDEQVKLIKTKFGTDITAKIDDLQKQIKIEENHQITPVVTVDSGDCTISDNSYLDIKGTMCTIKGKYAKAYKITISGSMTGPEGTRFHLTTRPTIPDMETEDFNCGGWEKDGIIQTCTRQINSTETEQWSLTEYRVLGEYVNVNPNMQVIFDVSVSDGDRTWVSADNTTYTISCPTVDYCT